MFLERVISGAWSRIAKLSPSSMRRERQDIYDVLTDKLHPIFIPNSDNNKV